ncbi:hypothetical protein FNI11_04310 [Salmonella enterica subsp. salamae]|nr:hypothetical protein [Salmonella enterica subsp. salamae]ECJ2280143.1 hypothetical protein [Salmonella enterica subsp. salamae]HCC0886851.1 hypothetical protein [Salmonella enterica]
MPVTSAGTYARAFNAESNLDYAAGNYENTLLTKIAKGVVGGLTLGIGYGIILLIEHYQNVCPKIEEYRSNAENIYHRLVRAVVTGEQVFKVRLNNNKILRVAQISHEFGDEPYLSISDGENVEVIKGTFKSILVKLSEEFDRAPGIYDVSNNYKPKEFFLEMNAYKIASVINYSPSTQQYENLYSNNFVNIYCALVKAFVRGNAGAKVALRDGGNIVFLTYLKPGTGRNMVKLINGELAIELECTFGDICGEMEYIFFLSNANKENETFESWINKSKNTVGAIPSYAYYRRHARCKKEAVKKRVAEANRRFNEIYGESLSSERTLQSTKKIRFIGHSS